MSLSYQELYLQSYFFECLLENEAAVGYHGPSQVIGIRIVGPDGDKNYFRHAFGARGLPTARSANPPFLRLVLRACRAALVNT